MANNTEIATPVPVAQAADSVNQKPVENHETNLAASSGLVTVDKATLVQAVNDTNAVDSASEHLPQMSMPLSLDKDVIRSHDDLAKLAGAALSNPADKDKFNADMRAFEERAEAQGLTRNQVKETYVQLASMLKPAPDSTLTGDERSEITSQLMSKLADPEKSSKQGWHDTCTLTTLEVKLLTIEPDKMIAKLAQVVRTGAVTTVDGDALDKMPADTTEMPMKVLKLDAGSLQPDREAQGKAVSADGRDYADQIAQVTLGNINWDSMETTPSGAHVQAGTMHYEQLEQVSRPTDSADGKGEDKSGERVVYTDPKTGEKTIYDGNGYGFGGVASSSEVSYVEAVVAGHNFMQKMALSRHLETYTDDPQDILIDSPLALKQQLEEMQKNHQFPMATKVEAANPAIIEDVIKRHPGLTPEQVPTDLWHSVLINGLNKDGTVEVYNPWGIKRNWTEAELYQAMGMPENRQPIS